MTTRLTIGRGYRRLKPGERLRKGDEFLFRNTWFACTCYNVKAFPAIDDDTVLYWRVPVGRPYRRRKPKKTTKLSHAKRN